MEQAVEDFTYTCNHHGNFHSLAVGPPTSTHTHTPAAGPPNLALQGIELGNGYLLKEYQVFYGHYIKGDHKLYHPNWILLRVKGDILKIMVK